MENKNHVCPPWVGKLMVNPLRKLFTNPESILSKFIESGYKIIEIGPGMGFFSLPMAKQTGSNGMVYCVDIQEDMLNNLEKRAVKAGVNEQITTLLSSENSLEIKHLENKIDFGLLFAVVHEIPNKELLFQELAFVLKQGSKILFAEPKGHVLLINWSRSLEFAIKAGFKVENAEKINGSHSALLIKL
ncbi:MAG: methyltransferase domain-containing protein [Salinivirgaceae bacterium]|jgi:ubiquinone/menaquinone biosynthesis C-methylase UbiE|nr:methyltransferase domain-containing protein [Salinivirgaceae bacterium]